MNVAALCLALSHLLAFCAGTAAVRTFTVEGETLRNVLLNEDGSLVLGSNVTLRRLAADLSQLQQVSLPAGQVSRLLARDSRGTHNDSILSCLRMSCALLDGNNLAIQRWEGNVLLNGVTNAHGLFVPGAEGRSVLTVALQNEVQPSAIRRGNLVGVGSDNQDFSILAVQAEGNVLFRREFLTVFESNGFSYYVNNLNIEARLVRICNNDNSSLVAAGGFVSYFEVKLECGGSGSVPTAATFLSSDQTITLSVTGGQSENLVCVFQLSEIHHLMTEKYDDCRAGRGHSGLARSGVFDCVAFDEDRLNDPFLNECNLVSSLLPSQEVENPLSADSVFSLPLNVGQFTSLIHSTLDNIHFLFAGTDNGKIYQYHYINRTSVDLIRFVNNEEMGESNITQLEVTSDGLTLYALSPGKLLAISVDVCDTYSSCETCLGEHRYPICGWCSLENRCSRQSECTAESAEWVSDGVGSCPVILSADPSIIYLRELEMGNLDIQLRTSNIPQGKSYQCWYNSQTSSEETQPPSSFATSAMRNNDIFTCPVLPGSVPAIPRNNDSLLSKLSLRYVNNNVAELSDPIRFSNCSLGHTSCTSCINSESQCRWCPFTFKCIDSRGESCSGVGEATVVESCPKLLQPENSDNYLIHTDYMYMGNPLVIRAENLDTYIDSFLSGKFHCVIRSGPVVLFTTAAVVDGDKNVECVRDKFDYSFEDGVAHLEARLDVEWINTGVSIDNPNRTGVTLYNCGRLGSNCAQCLAISSVFDCGFCSSRVSCLLNTQCSGSPDNTVDSVGQCPLATIESVSPTSGPVEGGTMVTIAGSNLATTRTAITNITIGGAECEIRDETYQPGVQFQCVTGRVLGRGLYPVEIEFSYLSQPRRGSAFTYEIPSLSSVSPMVGPQAGGTMVTITGNHLNIGSVIEVTLAGQKCFTTSVSQQEVICQSEPLNTIREDMVLVAIDNWSGSVSGLTYEYVENPTVKNISPDFSFASGGTEYVVLGDNFHIIQKPRLLIHLTTSQSERRKRQSVEVIPSEPCVTDSLGTRMTCQAPPIDPAPLSKGPLSATLGLQLDGVSSLLRIDNYTVTIYPNPVFRPFGTKSFSITDTIHLTVASTEGEFEFTPDMAEVVITPCSRQQCVCGDVTFNPGNMSFSCLVESTIGISRGSDHTVTVHIGNFNQSVGSIRINEPINPAVVIGGTIGSIVVVLAIVFLLGFIYFKRRASGKTSQTALTNITYRQEMVKMKGTDETKNGTAIELAQKELKAFIPRRMHIPNNQLRLLESVGHGEFGEVYKAHLIAWHGQGERRTVAVKTLRGLFSANDVQLILQEVVKMKNFKHRHVMQLIGVCLDSGVGVVMPFMANGSVLSYLKRERETLFLSKETDIEQILPARKLLMRMSLEIAMGMEYLAQQMFVHRDLAARNCMLDIKGCVKVGDFGLAEDMYGTGYVREDSKTVKIPYKWMPPESLEDALFSEQTDVWSYGVTCWEIFTVGKTPYPALDPPTLLRMLKEGHRLENPENAACSPEMYAVMKRCWKMSGEERPRFSELAATLDKALQSEAGYVELSMTLEETVTGGEEDDWEGYEVINPATEEEWSEYEVMKPASAEEVGSGNGPKMTVKEDCDDIPTGFNTAYGQAK